MRRFLQAQEGIEQNPAEFEFELLAWHHAVLIDDYCKMFRSGIGLKTTIYGDPYESDVRPTDEPEFSNKLTELHQRITWNGLQSVLFNKPDLSGLFPPPATYDQSQEMFACSRHDQMRLAYQQKYLSQMYNTGYRQIVEVGTLGYLNWVPDHLQLFTYCAPDGTKSFISQDGYLALGYDLQPDYERPLSQRGGFCGFPVSSHEDEYEETASQIDFLSMHADRFEFRSDDLLGYRPKDMSAKGLTEAWDGWVA